MGIDAGIYSLAGRGVKSVAEYDAEASQARQNKLAELMSGAKMEEYTRGVSETNKLNQLYSGALGSDGKVDRLKVLSGAASGGLGSKIPGLQKGWADQDKAQGDVDKQKSDMIDARLKQSKTFLDNIRTPEEYIQWHEANHKDPVLGPALAARGVTADQARSSITTALQQPGGFERLLQQSALGLDKFIEINKPTTSVLNNGGANQVIQTPGLGGTPQTVMTAPITQSANGKATDDRAREFNATKVEENKIKREAKDETANLTKSSQLASFDTMLGTLDRLGQHPGLARSVGAVGVFPTMPGSDSANFQAELNSFQSQAFIPMVAQLKGMGALSDAEGKKLTAAVGALDPKMGEQAFRDSVARITADMQAARGRMAGGGQPAPGEWRASTGTMGGAKPQAAPVSIKNAADYANIPSGATYIAPDGQMRVKK
jgi:hypothetical protein